MAFDLQRLDNESQKCTKQVQKDIVRRSISASEDNLSFWNVDLLTQHVKLKYQHVEFLSEHAKFVSQLGQLLTLHVMLVSQKV